MYDFLYSQPQRWIPNCRRYPHPAQIHSGKETGYDTTEITHKTTWKYHLEHGGVCVKLYSNINKSEMLEWAFGFGSHVLPLPVLYLRYEGRETQRCQELNNSGSK